MMMDTAWGVGATTSAPTMTGYSGMGFPDSVINGVTDYEIEGMIDDLGFFKDKDEDFSIHRDNNNGNFYSNNNGCVNPHSSTKKKNNNDASPNTIEESTAPSSASASASAIQKYATVSPANLPIITNDTGAVVAIPDHPVSTSSISIALPRPPQLFTTGQEKGAGLIAPSPISSADNANVQTVLEQQREAILKNQQIIEAQKNELQEQSHQIHRVTTGVSLLATEVPIATTATKSAASYSLARAALKKADEQIIVNDSNPGSSETVTDETGNRRNKVPSPSTVGGSANDNAYQKWKLTPAGATKLRALDTGGIASNGFTSSGSTNTTSNSFKRQEDPSTKNLTPGELEVRRYVTLSHHPWPSHCPSLAVFSSASGVTFWFASSRSPHSFFWICLSSFLLAFF